MTDGMPTTVTDDVTGYFDVEPDDNGIDCRRKIIETLEAMGFEIEASHHEVAEGQHEINFKYADALTAADNTVTFKWVVRPSPPSSVSMPPSCPNRCSASTAPACTPTSRCSTSTAPTPFSMRKARCS
jgi:hypothetical protein